MAFDGEKFSGNTQASFVVRVHISGKRSDFGIDECMEIAIDIDNAYLNGFADLLGGESYTARMVHSLGHFFGQFLHSLKFGGRNFITNGLENGIGIANER